MDDARASRCAVARRAIQFQFSGAGAQNQIETKTWKMFAFSL